MEKGKVQEKNEKLNEVMSRKLELIAEYITMGMDKCAKIETKALKAYLDFQLSGAKHKTKSDLTRRVSYWLRKGVNLKDSSFFIRVTNN